MRMLRWAKRRRGGPAGMMAAMAMAVAATVPVTASTADPLSAQEPAVRAYLESEEVSVGDVFRVIVEVSGVTEVENIIVPPIFGFSGRPEDGALPFATEITNPEAGEQGGVVVITYSYVAAGAGSVEVGPVLVTADGRNLETGLLTLQVRQPSDVSVRAHIEPAEVRLLGEFEIHVEVDGVDALLERPVLPDLSQFATEHGGGGGRGSVRFSFIAMERGTHEIGRISVKVGDRVYESEPLTLVVNDEPPRVVANAAFNTAEAWVGGDFLLAVVVEGVRELEEDPVLPDLSGLADLVRATGGGTSFGASAGISRFAVHHRYQFRALAPGRFELGPIRIRAAGQTVLTEPVSLTIGEAPPDPVRSPEDLRVTTEADKRRVYVGEPVIVSYGVLSRGSFGGDGWTVQSDTLRVPSQAGLRSQALGASFSGPEQVWIDGRRYRGGYARRVAFFPTQVGQMSIDPVEIGVQINRRRWPRARVFDPAESRARNQGDWVPMTLTTEPVAIEVVPLPDEGRPGSFRGRVGRLGVVSWVDRTDLAVGDTVALQVELSGDGHSRALPELEIAFPDGFEVLEPAVTHSNPRDEGGGMRGSITRYYRLIARAAGGYRIPAIELSYFDPESGSYGTTRGGSFDLTVGPGVKE